MILRGLFLVAKIADDDEIPGVLLVLLRPVADDTIGDDNTMLTMVADEWTRGTVLPVRVDAARRAELAEGKLFYLDLTPAPGRVV